MAHLALIEDDPQIRKTLEIGLTVKGLRVKCFRSAEDFLADEFNIKIFDIFLIDLGLPGMGGSSLCDCIRKYDPLKPVIIITAMTQESTAVAAFSKGADDFVRKPFGIDELFSRIQRLLGRGNLQRQIIRYEGLCLDRNSRSIRYNDNAVSLANKEYIVLALLIERAGELVPRERILTAIDGEGEINDRTLDSYISHLRKKLKSVRAENICILSIYGHGYKLEVKL
jgi:DNA-binding response OmpR family regulator